MTATDEEWDEAIDMLIAGVAKTQIAIRLQRHRNTITAWTRNPVFARLLSDRLAEHDASTRLRRVRQAMRYADRVHALADRALREAEQRPLDRGTRAAVRFWLRAYRRVLAMEAEALGGG